VVGAWVVRDPGGPFPWHLYVFNADAFAGTITARSYDAHGTLTDGPTRPTLLAGKRVTLP